MSINEEELAYPGKADERIFLSPGLELAISHFMPEKNLLVNVELDRLSLVLFFCLGGKMRSSFQGRNNTVTVNPGDAVLWFSPELENTIEYLTTGPLFGVCIHVDYQLLESFPENEPVQMLARFRGILAETEESFYCHVTKMRASMRIAVYQILNCFYEGFARQVYLSGKVLELLAYMLADISLEGVMLLTPQEKQKLFEAREILDENLENPPSLMALSRQVGLNDYKLKAGFREVFRTTVFGYLRRERLERSRRLLEEGETSVQEVAYSVGYSSLSYFAKAFTIQYGTRPGAYLAEMRRKNCLSG